MSGLEVVGLVCAIVSAFTGAAELIRRRKAKKEKKNAKEAVEKSLALGPPSVRGEYDNGFARLGPRFAKGDDVGSHELKDILIQLQSHMITTLHTMLESGATQQYDDFLGVSENSRIRAVSALIEQYQRMAVAMPLREVRTETTSFWSSPSVTTMLSAFRRRSRPVARLRPDLRSSNHIEEGQRRWEAEEARIKAAAAYSNRIVPVEAVAERRRMRDVVF